MRHIGPTLVAVGLLAATTSRAIRVAEAQQRRLSSAEHAAARNQLLAADSGHARATHSQGLVPGFVSSLADNAVYLEPGADHIHGKARIQAFLSGQSGRQLSFRPALAEVSADGRVGYVVGWTTLAISDTGAPTVHYGKYIAFWRRQPDGAWRVEVWSRSGAPEPPDAAPTLPPRSRELLGSSRAVDQAAETRAILGTDSAFAAFSVARGTAVAFYQYAAPHALALGGGKDFVVGREAIRDDQAANAAPGQTLDWKPVAGGVGPLGDLGWSVGEYRFTGSRDGKPVTAVGKYLTIWEKMPDGAWRFVADGGSSSAPPRP
jgi:ketosteroid isomerase-like protein